MIYGELFTWREHQGVIILEIDHDDTIIEIVSYKDKILNFEQINGGKYVLFDRLTNEIFIIYFFKYNL